MYLNFKIGHRKRWCIDYDDDVEDVVDGGAQSEKEKKERKREMCPRQIEANRIMSLEMPEPKDGKAHNYETVASYRWGELTHVQSTWPFDMFVCIVCFADNTESIPQKESPTNPYSTYGLCATHILLDFYV